jgi:hypothetical protein
MRQHWCLATLVVCLIAMSIAHAEKKIYACKDAAGNAIFLPNPCGAGSKELSVDPGLAPAPAAAPAKDATDASPPLPNAPQNTSDGVTDSKCRRDAQDAIFYPSDENLRDLRRRKENIVRDAANNNLGAAWEQRLRKQIDDMEIAIQKERTRITEAKDTADEVYRKAIADCDKHKAQRERERAAATGR